MYYRIRWKGWSAKDDTWQTEGDLSCGAILKKYQSTMAATASPKKRGRPSASAVRASPTKKKMKTGVAKGRVTKPGRPRGRKTVAAAGKRTASPTKKKAQKKRGRKPKSDKEWEVEEVMAVRTTESGKEEFYIKWEGYGSEENTWEPAENVANCRRAIERFRQAQNEEDGVAPLPDAADDEDADETKAENGEPAVNGDAEEAEENEKDKASPTEANGVDAEDDE